MGDSRPYGIDSDDHKLNRGFYRVEVVRPRRREKAGCDRQIKGNGPLIIILFFF